MERYDVAIVGGGVMGCATAHSLAKWGARTVLLEQFKIGHDRGSSHGTSRIFRYSYPETRYVEMAIEARALWEQLESESGEQLLVVTGGLDSGYGVHPNFVAMRVCGIECETVSTAEATRRWPAMAFPAGPELLHQEDAAMIAADRAVSVFARLAAERSAELQEGARVVSLEHPGDRVVVGLEGGSRLEAAAVVLTAGPWAPGLLASAGIESPLRPTRETVVHYELPGAPPPTYVEWGDPMIYALASPGIGLKAGEHQAGPTVDPDSPPHPDEKSLRRLEEWVRARYPRAGNRMKVETCLYTNAPGDELLIQRHGAIVLGSPCSGHGFKFAPLIGARLAALALEAR